MFASNGRVTPVFDPNTTLVYNWIASRGARIDITTHSFYAHDRWSASKNLSIDLGVALREGAHRSHRRDHRRRHRYVGAQARGDVRPARQRQVGAPGNLRALLGQVQRSAVRQQHGRGEPEPRDLPVRGTGGPGPRFRAGLRSVEPRGPDLRQLPHRQRAVRRRAPLADQQGVHAVGRRRDRHARLREGHLRAEAPHGHARGLHRSQQRADRGGAGRRRLRRVRHRGLEERARLDLPRLQGAGVPGPSALRHPLPDRRQLHRAAAQPRQLRGRSRQSARHPEPGVRLSGSCSTPTATSLSGVSPATSVTRSAC